MQRIIHSPRVEGSQRISRKRSGANASSQKREPFDKQLESEKDEILLSNENFGNNRRNSAEIPEQYIPEQLSAGVNKNIAASISGATHTSSTTEELADTFSHSAVAEKALIEEEVNNRVRQIVDREKAKLQAEIDQRKIESEVTGYQDGLEKAGKELSAEYEKKIAETDSLINSLKELLTKEIYGLEDICLELVFESLAKILGTELKNEQFVTDVVSNVISRAGEGSNLIIHVNARDEEILRRNLDGIRSKTGQSNIEIIPDARVAIGGCLAQNDGGAIDGRIELQLNRLKDALIGAKNL